MYSIFTYIWLILITYGYLFTYIPSSIPTIHPFSGAVRPLVSGRVYHPATPEAQAPPQFQHEAHEGHGQRDNKSHGSLPHHTWPPASHAGRSSVRSLYPRDPGSPKLRMVMEPKYLSKEVIIHPNHHLRR